MSPRTRALRPAGDDGFNPAAWLREQSEAVEEAAPEADSVLSEIFAEEPVPLDVFIRDNKFIGMSSLSDPQYRALQVAERIYYPEHYPYMCAEWPYWTPIPVINFLTMMIGKGGGKDMIARLASIRIAYLLLCMKNPKTYFGMPADESIHLLNVASTRDQARLAYFEPMTRIVSKGWFKDRCNPLRTVIEWDKGITSISGSSDAETQEGLNLLLGIADEVDAFRTADEMVRHKGVSQRMPLRSAEGIVRMLSTSGVTRFPRTFKNIRISYPRFFGSPISLLHSKATENIRRKGEESKHYVVGPMPSWDFNPLLARGIFVKIPESPVPVPEEVVEDFESDRDWACAAYLCRPARSRLPPYFRSEAAVDAALVESPEIRVSWEYHRGAWHAQFAIPRALVPAPGAVYACHADLAITQDRAGIAMAHVVSWDTYMKHDIETGEEVTFEHLPVVRVDCAVSLEADLRAIPPREIQLRAVRELVFDLQQRGFTIGQVSMDGFQSKQSRQELVVAGIPAPLFSVDRKEDPYKLFRTMVEEGRARMPSSLLLRKELLGLQQDPRTLKIDHATDGSKDLADAVCGAVNGAVALGGSESTYEDSTEDEVWTSSPVAPPLGAFEAGFGTFLPHSM